MSEAKSGARGEATSRRLLAICGWWYAAVASLQPLLRLTFSPFSQSSLSLEDSSSARILATKVRTLIDSEVKIKTHKRAINATKISRVRVTGPLVELP